MELSKRKCVPCEGGVPRLEPDRVKALLADKEVQGWTASADARKIEKQFQFDDFRGAMSFVNKMADVAESENHHPDFSVRYSVVDVTLRTHAINGLSDNDFILAAKIDQL
jgi:4a-hydroxytetrahydrobiopterin dehydratase